MPLTNDPFRFVLNRSVISSNTGMPSTFVFFFLNKKISNAFTPIYSIRITHNEPFCVSAIGYGYARFAPGRSSDRHKSKEGDSSKEPWMWVLQMIDD